MSIPHSMPDSPRLWLSVQSGSRISAVSPSRSTTWSGHLTETRWYVILLASAQIPTDESAATFPSVMYCRDATCHLGKDPEPIRKRNFHLPPFFTLVSVLTSKVRFVTAFHRPSLPLVRQVTIARPASSSRANLPPVKGLLFFDGSEKQLASATELVIDFPGGGFIAMGPDCHEERLRRWAKRTGKPVLGIDYGKAPECESPRSDGCTIC